MITRIAFLNYHFRFIDMSIVYDQRPQFLSQIFAGTMVFIFRMFGHLVRAFEHPWTVQRQKLVL